MGLFDSFRSKPADEPRDKDGIPVEELPDTPAGSLRPASGELPSGEAEFYNPYKGLQSSLDLRGAGRMHQLRQQTLNSSPLACS